MGARQDNLVTALKAAGCMVRSKNLSRPQLQQVADSPYGQQVLRVYRKLGGVQDEFPLRLGKWDVELEHVTIELDEDLHFNRYRLTTLKSPVYDELPHFPRDSWKRYCKHHEQDCLKAGGYGGTWSNDSCVRQFGPPGPLKDLNGSGAPRWKQRAFYDFVKDLTPLILGFSVVRISIWDELPGDGSPQLVGTVLQEPPSGELGRQLLELIESRRSMP